MHERVDINEIKKGLNSIASLKNLTYSDIDKFGEKLGCLLVSSDVSSSQLRKIHSIIKDVAFDIKSSNASIDKIFLIPPRLAYIAGRQQKAKEVCDLLSNIIRGKVKDKEDLSKLSELIDSILAYFVYYERRKK